MSDNETTGFQKITEWTYAWTKMSAAGEKLAENQPAGQSYPTLRDAVRGFLKQACWDGESMVTRACLDDGTVCVGAVGAGGERWLCVPVRVDSEVKTVCSQVGLDELDAAFQD